MRAVISTLLLSSVDSTGIEGSTVTLVRHTEIHTPIFYSLLSFRPGETLRN
jgi:hypothetical protein